MRGWVPLAVVLIAPLASAGAGLVQEDQKYIRIEMLQYDPPYVQAKVGEPVTWVNSDTCANGYGGPYDPDCKVHTASTWYGAGPDSPELEPGGRYTFAFGETGVYHVHCARHGYIQGVVVVS